MEKEKGNVGSNFGGKVSWESRESRLILGVSSHLGWESGLTLGVSSRPGSSALGVSGNTGKAELSSHSAGATKPGEFLEARWGAKCSFCLGAMPGPTNPGSTLLEAGALALGLEVVDDVEGEVLHRANKGKGGGSPWMGWESQETGVSHPGPVTWDSEEREGGGEVS